MATSELKSKYAKKARKEGQKLLKEQHAPHAKRVFKEFDTDSSGSIDGAELVKVVRKLLPDLKLKTEGWKELVVSVLAAGDKDGDGTFDFEEFLNFYVKCLATPEAVQHYEEKVQVRFEAGKMKLVEPQHEA